MSIQRLPVSLPPAEAPDLRAVDALRDPAANVLRARASSDPKSVIKAAAKQFEALFMQQLMKSMRESTMASGMLDNAGTQMGTEMLDTQFANQMTGRPGGLGDVIARQLERQMTGTAPALPGQPVRALPAANAAGAPDAGDAAVRVKPGQEDFLRLHQGAASAAEAQTGIPAAFMVAQAAHESGWGRHEIRNDDGSSSFNLFGIKAGAGWKGKVAQVTTTEVVDGQPRKVVAKFRAYDSYDASFRDYAQLMKDNPRYAGVVTAAAGPNSSVQGFAQGLQRAGYATDPAYADKLTRVINTTLRLQRAALSTPQTLA
jgi:flagellar protein FlgJ